MTRTSLAPISRISSLSHAKKLAKCANACAGVRKRWKCVVGDGVLLTVSDGRSDAEGHQLLHLFYRQLHLLPCGCHHGCNTGRKWRRAPLPCKTQCVERTFRMSQNTHVRQQAQRLLPASHTGRSKVLRSRLPLVLQNCPVGPQLPLAYHRLWIRPSTKLAQAAASLALLGFVSIRLTSFHWLEWAFQFSAQLISWGWRTDPLNT